MYISGIILGKILFFRHFHFCTLSSKHFYAVIQINMRVITVHTTPKTRRKSSKLFKMSPVIENLNSTFKTLCVSHQNTVKHCLFKVI